MSNARLFPTWKRFIAMLLLAVAVVVLMLGIRASAAQACSSGHICIWTGSFYAGSLNYLGCLHGSGWVTELPTHWSAKNRCGVAQEIGWREGGTTNWKACMWPGGERPDPGRFNVQRYRESC